jgi:HAD superfamily hydrolase (TIGR01509 family)
MPAILFDFNGVIVNDEPQHCDSLIATLSEYGIELDRESYYRDYLGFDDRECFRFTFARHGRPADADAIADAIERKAGYYERAIRRSMELVPGAVEFINAAAGEGLALAVVSGALRREIDLVLGVAGIRQHFSHVTAAEDVSACKPDPQGYLRACAALGEAAGHCVVIEDSLPGLAAARAARLPCAMLATSHARDQLSGADVVWDNFTARLPADLPWSNGRH